MSSQHFWHHIAANNEVQRLSDGTPLFIKQENFYQCWWCGANLVIMGSQDPNEMDESHCPAAPPCATCKKVECSCEKPLPWGPLIDF
jgi:hypothetical protein